MKHPAVVPDIRPGPRRGKWIVGLVTAGWLCLPIQQALAAGGKPANKLVNVADTRNLPPGVTRWMAEVYNTSHWQFALLVVVLMAGMGLILGWGCDRIIGLLGIDLGKIKHHE